MTPQEQQLLSALTDRVNQTVLTEKDPDAARYLQDTLGRNPDALYLLAQTVLVQNYALDQARQQIQQAQQQSAEPKHATSFLGSLLGFDHDDKPAPPPPRYTPVPNAPTPQYAQQQYSQPQYGQPQYAQPQYAQGFAPQSGIMGGGGFLRSAMQTAAGVAAGALAFEGIESLMHGFGQHAGYGGGQGFGNFGGGNTPGETVNNYYGDSAHSANPDIEDRRNDAADTSLADNDPDDFASNDTSNDTASNDSYAETDPDDFSSSDDSSSFDSSSSDDSNS